MCGGPRGGTFAAMHSSRRHASSVDSIRRHRWKLLVTSLVLLLLCVGFVRWYYRMASETGGPYYYDSPGVKDGSLDRTNHWR